MRRLHAASAFAAVVSISVSHVLSADAQVSQVTTSDASPCGETHSACQINGERHMWAELLSGHKDDSVSRTTLMPDAVSNNEERGYRDPLSVAKFVKDKFVLAAKTIFYGFWNGLKSKSLKKLWYKLPFVRPKKAPKKELSKGIKDQPFRIPFISNAIVQLKLKYWLHYGKTPHYVYKQLKIGSKKPPSEHVYYPYYRKYVYAWQDDQKFLES